MRALFALVVWLASLTAAAGGEGVHMVAEDDVIYLADMAAPPWTASANEQTASDHAGFDDCEQLVKRLAPSVGSITQQTYTTSLRWGKILRTRIASDAGGSPMLVTCWIAADGHGSVVVKVDDGEP
jgi:hypothetical protein